MAIINSGLVLRPWNVIVLQPVTSRLCLVTIIWLSARSMHLVVLYINLMTDDPDLLPVVVIAPIANSDQLSSSAFISLAQAVPNSCVSWKVFHETAIKWEYSL